MTRRRSGVKMIQVVFDAFDAGYRQGLLHGVLWALGIEAVIAGLVVLIVKVV